MPGLTGVWRSGAVCAAAAGAAAGLTLAACVGCSSPGGLVGHMAVVTAPEKKARASDSELARRARDAFWEALEGDDYARLDEDVIELLTAAYVEEPRDPSLALLLGQAHLWRVTERSRLAEPEPARVTESLMLAEHYLSEARALAPEDERIGGWLASARMASGTVNEDQREIREGYYILKDAARAFPEFNAFTFGYAMSGVSATSPRYEEAMEAMWRCVNACADGGVERDSPSEAVIGDDPDNRICTNVEKAPHNTEGFWLNYGDMLLKDGRVEAGREAYANARRSDTYEQWPYRHVLEDHEARAEELAVALRAGEEEMMINSSHGCVGCHAR